MTKKEVKEEKKRMHSIILKEKDTEGNWLSIDVDYILPIHMFGEAYPIVMGVVDDRAYFIPLETMNWFEQNFGVERDTELAHKLAEAKRTTKKGDVASSYC